MADTTLASAVEQAPLTSAPQPAPIRIALRRGLLSVSRGGRSLVRHLELPGWATALREEWRVGFVSRAMPPGNGDAAPDAPPLGSHRVDKLQLLDTSGDGHLREETVSFAVSINAQQFSPAADQQIFNYYAPPAISFRKWATLLAKTCECAAQMSTSSIPRSSQWTVTWRLSSCMAWSYTAFPLPTKSRTS